MATVRLTQGMKDQIHAKLMLHRFGDRRDALKALNCKLGMAVYLDLTPPAMRRKLKDIPHEWLHLSSANYVKFGGDFICLSFGRSLPFSRKQGTAVYAADHPLTGQYRDFLKVKDQLNKDEIAAQEQAKAVLDACPSAKALLEAWPEVAPFLVGVIPTPATKALAILPEVLNTTFALPVKKTKQRKAA